MLFRTKMICEQNKKGGTGQEKETLPGARTSSGMFYFIKKKKSMKSFKFTGLLKTIVTLRIYRLACVFSLILKH